MRPWAWAASVAQHEKPVTEGERKGTGAGSFPGDSKWEFLWL